MALGSAPILAHIVSSILEAHIIKAVLGHAKELVRFFLCLQLEGGAEHGVDCFGFVPRVEEVAHCPDLPAKRASSTQTVLSVSPPGAM